MVYEFTKNRHSVYTLNYHLVQCVKYRKNALEKKEVIDELKKRTHNVANSYGVKITAIETDKNHVHILFDAQPQTDLVKFVNNWKSATSRAIRNKFPEIKKKLWKDIFWSNSYCLITTGQITLDKVKEYVRSQRR